MHHSVTALDLGTAELSEGFTRVFEYWNEIRGERRFPSWRDVDMMALPLAMIPWCTVVDVKPGGEDFIFRFFGTARVYLQGRDYTGRSVKEFSAKPVAEKVFGELQAVMRHEGPLLFRTSLLSGPIRPTRPASYEVLRLPFASGGDIDTILNMVDYTTVSRLLYDWFGIEPPITMIFDDEN